MWLGLTSNLYGSLCCSSFYVAWSRIRSVWVSMLCEFQYRLVSHPFCMGLYVVRVSMSLGLASVLYGSLCCPSFYFTCSLYRSVWVSILSDFLCHLMSPRSVLVFMLSWFLCHLVSLPFCMGLYFVRFSMSLNFTSVLYVLLCCPSLQVTWSHFRFVWFSMLSEFLYWFSLSLCSSLC
jgi:hypothetical protein